MMHKNSILVLALLAVSYFVAGKLGLKLAYIHISATAVWPPTGIAIAALLIFGYRFWPAIFVGAFLVNITTAGNFGTSFGIALGNTLEPFLGAYLVNKFAHGYRFLEDTLDFKKFLFFAGILATSVSATIGVVTLTLGGLALWSKFIPIWLTWWLGDMTGALIVAPFIILLFSTSSRKVVKWSWPKIAELIILFAALIASGLIVFDNQIIPTHNYPIAFLTIPALVLMALRFGQLENAVSIIMLSSFALWGDLHGYGSFGAIRSPNTSLIFLQLFLGVAAVMNQIISSTVSNYKKTQKSLQENEKRFSIIANNIHDSIIVLDKNGIIFANDAAAEILSLGSAKNLKPGKLKDGYAVMEVKDEAGRVLYPDEYPTKLAFGGKRTVDKILCYTNKETGKISWHKVSAKPVLDSEGQVELVMAFSTDITSLIRSEENLRHQVLHDQLTNLPNRQAAQERLDMAIGMAKRNKGKLAVLFLDLDNFKNINDSLGHETGDILLREVAYRLKNMVREEDTVARLGGDEFLIILNDIGSVVNATKIAEKILTALKPTIRINSNNLNVVGSLGMAIYPNDGVDFTSLFRGADMAMYRAKETSRGRFQLYNLKMNTALAEKMLLEKNIREAFDKREFSLFFQPYVNLNTGALQGVEALVRWNHPKLGLLRPNYFISLAEETGLIVPLGDWVVETACKEIKKWTDKGIALKVSVNLSARQFSEPKLVQHIASILKTTGLESKYLELEITESIAMQSVEQTKIKLKELRKMGISIAIDDFGCGYSSLGYLKNFPVQKLKIDSSFVQKMTTDKRDSALVHAIISLGHELGLKVCAEGIEGELHRTLLDAMGCDLGQGFLVSKPLPSNALKTWIEDNQAKHTFVV